jgi:hypothetical protein
MIANNKYLVIGAKPLDFTGENGQKIRMCKVFYLPNVPSENGTIGYEPITLNADFDKIELFKEGPGYYELGFTIVPGTRGTPKMVLTTAKLVKKVDFSAV